MSSIRLLAAIALACAGFCGAASAQQGPPPPAVLVQPAELKPLVAQAEFIGRAAAVDKVDLQARVKGFLGPRKFTDGDEVKEGQVLFTIEPEPYQATVDQKIAQRDAAKAALDNAEIQLKRAAELLRTNTGTQATYDQRPASSSRPRRSSRRPRPRCATPRSSSPTPRSSRRSPAASARPRSRPATSSAPIRACWRPSCSENPMRVLFSVTQRELLEARKDGATDGNGAARAAAAGRRQPLQGEGQDRLPRRHGRPQDRRPDRARRVPQHERMLTDGQTVRVVIESAKPPSVVAISAGGGRARPGRRLRLRRQRQEPGRAAPGQDRHGARRPAGRRGGPEGGREGHHPGPAAGAARHDRRADDGARRLRPRRRAEPMTISSVFIRRPRLAFVISTVISIAGLIALTRAAGRAVPRHRAAAGPGHRAPIPAPRRRRSRRAWRRSSRRRSTASSA